MTKIPIRNYRKRDGTKVSEHLRQVKAVPIREKFENPKKVTSWKQLDSKTIEAQRNDYDMTITRDNGEYYLDVFDHKIRDNDKAHLESESFDTIKDAKVYVEDNYPTRSR